MSSSRRLTVWLLVVAIAGLGAVAARAQGEGGSRTAIATSDLRDWLSYVASDELEGRASFSEGLGLAAGYIAEHLRAWGVRPAGDNGGYLQQVGVLDVSSTSRSTITVDVAGERRTFRVNEDFSLPAYAGGSRTFTVSDVEFLGYGLTAPSLGHDDYAGKDVEGKVVVWLGAGGPPGISSRARSKLLSGRNQFATDERRALAVVGPSGGRFRTAGRPGGAGYGTGLASQAGHSVDFTTTQRLDAPMAPVVSASDDFLAFLFSQAETRYAELRTMAERRQTLPTFALQDVTVTFNLDTQYEVVRTRYSHNVVGIVEGTDPQLSDSFVAFGAHYDHLGLATGPLVGGAISARREGAPGRVTSGAVDDIVWNGADDNGSGIVALMALAKAFVEGRRPRRSLLFVWHTGEERGLWGSRYFVDHPPVPIDRVVAQLNMDMIGRNRDNKPEEANSVYLIGSDRISTELHNLSEAVNAGLPEPLTLDYTMNAPAHPERFYVRSDHYSYAAKGIPVIFYTTGLHPDYHANTDEVDRIDFEKMTRIAELVYETGMAIANLDRPPARDNRGPRAGTGTAGSVSSR